MGSSYDRTAGFTLATEKPQKGQQAASTDPHPPG